MKRWAQKTGLAYDGPELNEPVEFVSSLAGDRTATSSPRSVAGDCRRL
jgi:hypothetical protein